MTAEGPSAAALEAAAEVHHQLFTGLILSFAGLRGMDLAAKLVLRTFRRQHDERFVPGLVRLGLEGLPPAVGCARYICLANRAGGLDVELHEEHERKAWVRYPPPRWAYEGAAICASWSRGAGGWRDAHPMMPVPRTTAITNTAGRRAR